jgi:hypothetical protein
MKKQDQNKLLTEIMQEDAKDGLYDLEALRYVAEMPKSLTQAGLLQQIKNVVLMFIDFREEYRRIERYNHTYKQIKLFGGQSYTWIGDSDDKIWDAFVSGKQKEKLFDCTT